jgi:hypothetical protein
MNVCREIKNLALRRVRYGVAGARIGGATQQVEHIRVASNPTSPATVLRSSYGVYGG